MPPTIPERTDLYAAVGVSWSAIDMPYADSKAVFNGTV